MCGINGFNFLDEKKMSAMNTVLAHRGPDGKGVYLEDNVTLGHTRLAVIDRGEVGAQPMHYGENLTIVFNGEIYNYLELRQELEQMGYVFTTHSDTEVILASYQHWGEKCVSHFNGMWAFCIYNREQKILFCSRDRFGTKPFYFYAKEDIFVFSSEIQGLLEHKDLHINTKENIDTKALGLYLSLGYIPAPHSIYKDIKKLASGYNAVYDLSTNTLRSYRYYKLPKYAPVLDKHTLIQEGAELLRDAIRLRMRSDVPVGAFLSGGLDSGMVVANMQSFIDLPKLHTFSIGFEGTYDETPYADLLQGTFGTHHHHAYFGEKDFERLQREHSNRYQEPFGDYSSFPMMQISQMAREHVTVALSGDGGDEVFAGYRRYVLAARIGKLYRVPRIIRRLLFLLLLLISWAPLRILQKLQNALILSLGDPTDVWAGVVNSHGFQSEYFVQWSRASFKESLDLAGGSLSEAFRIQDVLYNSLADNYLTKVDRASMGSALEVRSPFLDYRMIEFAQKIPTELKVSAGGKTKELLRDIAQDVIPDAIRVRGKQGFTPPLKEWVCDARYDAVVDEAYEVLLSLDWSKNDRHGLLALRSGGNKRHRVLVYLFALWYDRYLQI